MLHITPQNNTIEFQLQIENASIENTSTRLIVNAGGENIITPLSIDGEGNCKGTIPLKEEWDGTSGDIKIEVITEGNYFEPFSKKVIFDSIPKTPKAKIEEIILSPSEPIQEFKPQPVITESKNVKKKKTISEVEKPKTFTKKHHQSKKSKPIKKTEPIVQPPRPIVQEKPKKDPVLEIKKPEVKIDNEISNEAKSFFLESKPKTIKKENKIRKKQKSIVQEKSKKEPVLEVKKPEVKKEPVLEVKKPEVKIDSEISNEIKSFFLGNKPKKIIKENKIIKKEEVEESIAKEAENFFKSN